MPVVSFHSSGEFRKTEDFLKKMSKGDIFRTLKPFAQQGVQALKLATPVESGATANAWDYEVKRTRDTYTITWTNNHQEGGAPIAIMLQYGHGTGTGGYVQGRDYINPAIRPVFDKIAEDVWKAVRSA